VREDKRLADSAEKLAVKSHPKALRRVAGESWRELRSEARRRNRNWRLALIVGALAAVYALTAYLYLCGR